MLHEHTSEYREAVQSDDTGQRASGHVVLAGEGDGGPGASRDVLKTGDTGVGRPAGAGWKRLVVLAEVACMVVLLGAWLLSEELRADKSLWVLFLSSIPAEAFIATVPHEPILLFFGKFYGPLTVALVATGGTVVAELLNYSIISHVAEGRHMGRIKESPLTARVTRLFEKAPFSALLVAGFTPVPFYPFRFLVVLARYSRLRYVLAVVLARGPRFYLLALLGREVRIPDQVLIALFVAIVIVSGLWVWRNRSRGTQA